MDSYVSCIKIRGQSILPPMMTDQVRAESRYYKQLALAVEEKLSNLKLKRQLDTASLVSEAIDESGANSPQEALPTTDSFPRQEAFPAQNESEPPDELSKDASEDGTSNRSTDINMYMNISDSSKTDITETLSEMPKPRVPNTLDIIPITLDAPCRNESTLSLEAEEFGDKTPKLMRQGSYTLETPSPMLLAHLKEDYVPTSTADASKRPQWTMAQPKAQWQWPEVPKKQPSVSKRVDIRPGARRTSISESASCNQNDKNSYTKVPGCRVARSVDCIQSMLAHESTGSKKATSIAKSRSTSGMKVLAPKTVGKSKNKLPANLPSKFGGSLSTLSNGNTSENPKNSKIVNSRMTKSFEECSGDKYESKCSLDNLKPLLASDKLLYVLKEVQKTHEQQMADLMARQRREQTLMQKEFEKQQLMLLAHIEKSFPGVSLDVLVQKLTDTSTATAPSHGIVSGTSLPKSVDRNGSCNSSSPLNSSSLGSDGSISISFTDVFKGRMPEQGLSRERRKSSVSRELFPGDSDAAVPASNGPVYDTRHIKAATVINAYARGYLVRRLMKCERVLTLKRTYQEALHCMLKLHVDAPLKLAELQFLQRLRHQCDAASISIVDMFAQSPAMRMEIIASDRQIKKARHERPTSARSSFSFATQRTLARKKFKEMGIVHMPDTARSTCSARTRCQTWTSNTKDIKRPAGITHHGIKRSTSAGAVRKPWR